MKREIIMNYDEDIIDDEMYRIIYLDEIVADGNIYMVPMQQRND